MNLSTSLVAAGMYPQYIEGGAQSKIFNLVLEQSSWQPDGGNVNTTKQQRKKNDDYGVRQATQGEHTNVNFK